MTGTLCCREGGSITRIITTFAITLAILAIAPAAAAQEPHKVYRVGLLDAGASTPSKKAQWREFEVGMRESGYVEGRNIIFEWRWAHGKTRRLNNLARELVDLKVDVIVTVATPAVFAARRATSKIPIVIAIASGSAVIPSLVNSLALPSGNVTGMLSFGQQMTAKRLELAKEIFPSASRFALLGAASHPGFVKAIKATKAAAAALGVTLLEIGIKGHDDLKAAFSTMAKNRIDAFVVAPSGVMGSLRNPLAKLMTRAGLPGILPDRRYASAGGLLALGTNLPEQFRGAALFVDKILKGTDPTKLPAQRQTKFDLVVNLKTAKTLGITMPSSVLLRATEVIE